MSEDWFETWFNTPEYHQLYKNRDDEEASRFIDNLINYLKPHPESKFLDIACGKGRHAKHIFDKGYETIGYDLSQNSIIEAKKFEQTGLNFYVHDMRKLFWTNYFDFTFNLFTSFGYFNSENDEINAIKSAAKSLKKGGYFVIDFLNREKVIQNLIPEESKNIDGKIFLIKKEIKSNQVVKSITFEKEGKQREYQEKVKLLGLSDFEKYLSMVGLKIKATFGDYDLNTFDENNSNRLIIIAQ